MSDIVFLRQLGEDLQGSGPKRGFWEACCGTWSIRRWPARKLTALLGVAALAVAALLWWTLAQSGSQGPKGEQVIALNGRGARQVTGSDLWAIDASSPDNVWAVGRAFIGDNGGQQALVLHWDGSSWEEIGRPDFPLTDVAVVSAKDVWGIGGDIDQAKIFHWDGTRWSEMAHQDPPGASFAGIDAQSTNDVWVVGTKFGQEYAPDTVENDTLIEHWNGTQWSVLASPNPMRRSNWLGGVAALSPSDVWATGHSEGHSESPAGQAETLTLHWDGQTWSIVPSPNPGRLLNVAGGPGTDGAGGVWAGGHYLDDLDDPDEALYMRWDGKAWQVVPPPRGDASRLSVGAFAGSSANDVWAVGSEPTGSFLIAHWDGSICKEVKAELPPGSEDSDLALHDVVAPSADEAWAVGSYQLTTRVGSVTLVKDEPVLERWDGSAWRLVKLPPIAT
jgi:hypothetical protein